MDAKAHEGVLDLTTENTINYTNTMKTRLLNAKAIVMAAYTLLSMFVWQSAKAQNIDMNNCMTMGIVHTFELTEGQAFTTETISVVNATATVFWQFDFPAPISPDGDVVESNGVTVTIPVTAGDPEGTPVSNAEQVEVSSAGAHTAGEFNFQVTVANNDGALSCQQEYRVKVFPPPLDLALVLDHSGSMNTVVSGSTTRWIALRDALSEFFLTYESLLDEHPNDQVTITYFDSDLLPVSACCSGLTPVVAGIGTTITNELSDLNNSTDPTDNPGGSTGMGNGLKDAAGKLTNTANARTIFVFTDGRQNVPLPTVNGDGVSFSDGSAWVGGNTAGDVKIFTVGIDDPDGDYAPTLQAMANNNRGTFNSTIDGTGLGGAFTDTFVDILSEFSPQFVAVSKITIPQGVNTLESFPLNNRINKLLVRLKVDRKMETPQLAQLIGRIRVAKDGTDVTGRATPRFIGNFTNTVQLAFDFDLSIGNGNGDLRSGGNWTVGLLDVSDLRLSEAEISIIAEDHHLDFSHELGNNAPLVDDPLQPEVTLAWEGEPVTDANVRAIIGVPGTDWGELLSGGDPVDAVGGVDAPLPGSQKFNHLYETDPAFRDALARLDNVVQLNHAGDGIYTAPFNGNDKAGIGNIIYLVSGSHPDAGDYQRFATESFYTSFEDVDLAASNIVIQSSIPNGLVFQITPVTSSGVLVGPAMSSVFAVDNPNVTLDVLDLQNGTYRVTANGPVSSPVELTILDKEVYSGPLDQISSDKSFLEQICDFLSSIGLPCSAFWIILVIILLIIGYLIWRRMQSSP